MRLKLSLFIKLIIFRDRADSFRGFGKVENRRAIGHAVKGRGQFSLFNIKSHRISRIIRLIKWFSDRTKTSDSLKSVLDDSEIVLFNKILNVGFAFEADELLDSGWVIIVQIHLKLLYCFHDIVDVQV